VDDQVDAAAAPVQLHADRVDEERHVVGHDLDGRVGGLPAVLLEARVVDAHLRRAGRPLAREVERADREAVQIERVAVGHVLGGDPAVELPRERFGQLGIGPVQLLAHTRAHRLGQRLLGILDLHLSCGDCIWLGGGSNRRPAGVAPLKQREPNADAESGPRPGPAL
jgi:hypothetical protein